MVQLSLDGQPRSTATFSPCRNYRYCLFRLWNSNKPTILFIGLNPSTADETTDDPTIRRCINFAKEWGYGSLFMGNLFAKRSTDPKKLKIFADPIGKENDNCLKQMALQSTMIVAMWGSMGSFLSRGIEVRKLFPKLYILGLTHNKQPKHPLYLPSSTKLFLWTS